MIYATIEDNKVRGYTTEPITGSVELTNEEYLRQINSVGVWTKQGEAYTLSPYPPVTPTPEEVADRNDAIVFVGVHTAMAELARLQLKTLTLTPVERYKIRFLYPQWKDLIGSPLKKVDTPYLMNGKDFYLVNQDHTPQAQWIPGSAGTDALYSLVPEPGTIAEWVQPQGAHDAYNAFGSGLPKSDPVTYQGKTWKNTKNANTYAPGVYGWEIL